MSRILGSVAECAAAEMGFAVAIAIVDHEGLLEYFARMEGTLPVSTELAVSKAYTAAALRMTTREVGQLALPGNPLYGIQHSHGGKIILFGGGVPLKLRGQVSGGIGISGGTVEEDEQVAGVVLDRLGEMERLAEWIKPLLPGKLPGNNRTSHLERRIGKAFLKEDGILPLEFSPILCGAFIIAFHDNP
ncbi:MAG: heme-binding protein [Syntrophales bacterium]|nr:heme-binding protein [Syntrophales bacterium]